MKSFAVIVKIHIISNFTIAKLDFFLLFLTWQITCKSVPSKRHTDALTYRRRERLAGHNR